MQEAALPLHFMSSLLPLSATEEAIDREEQLDCGREAERTRALVGTHAQTRMLTCTRRHSAFHQAHRARQSSSSQCWLLT